jgi:hypothetical protein
MVYWLRPKPRCEICGSPAYFHILVLLCVRLRIPKKLSASPLRSKNPTPCFLSKVLTGERSTKSHESTRNQTNTKTVRDNSCDLVDRYVPSKLCSNKMSFAITSQRRAQKTQQTFILLSATIYNSGEELLKLPRSLRRREKLQDDRYEYYTYSLSV